MSKRVTWNPNDKGEGVKLDENNLQATITNIYKVRANTGRITGRWYWEITIKKISGTDRYIILDVDDKDSSLSNWWTTRGYHARLGNKVLNSDITQYGEPFYVKDTIGIALDLDIGTIEFFKNGISQGIAFSDLLEIKKELYPSISVSATGVSCIIEANFGAIPFKYPIPEDFLPYDIDNADWFTFRNLIYKDNKYYTYQDNEFIEVEPTIENFEKYGIDLLDVITIPTDKVRTTMEVKSDLGDGREFSKVFDMTEFKKQFGNIKKINEV